MPVVVHRAPVVLPIAAPPIRDGAVAVRDGVVLAVGPASDLDGDMTVEHPGLLAPGLVNAHAHLQYGPSFADLADGTRAFPDWISTLVQRRAATDGDGWRAETQASWRLARAAGTVAVADVVTDVAALDVAVPGARYLESVAVPSAGWPAERARLTRLLGAHPEAGLSPHTLYTLGTEVVRGVTRLARAYERRLHPHLAETTDEAEYVLAGTGRLATLPVSSGLELATGGGAGVSPAHHLDALGGLGPDVHVAHGVHLDAADRALLRARRTPVALCARSNRILGAGEPPVAALLAEGGPVCVGTDSLASTPDLDLLGEVRVLAEIARRQGYADPDLARCLVAAATAGGAAAIGRADLGAISAGATAALVTIDVGDPAAPDPYEEVVRTGRARPADWAA